MKIEKLVVSSFEESRNFSSFLAVPFTGFGYPLNEINFPTLGKLFTSQTLMGFTLQSISPIKDRNYVTPNSFRSYGFSPNTFKPGVSASAI